MKNTALLSRRDLLTKGFKTAAALGLGAIALNHAGDLTPFAVNAMNDLTSGALDFTGEDSCILTCSQTLEPCYYAANLTRRDITEGQAGLPLRLGLATDWIIRFAPRIGACPKAIQSCRTITTATTAPTSPSGAKPTPNFTFCKAATPRSTAHGGAESATRRLPLTIRIKIRNLFENSNYCRQRRQTI